MIIRVMEGPSRVTQGLLWYLDTVADIFFDEEPMSINDMENTY